MVYTKIYGEGHPMLVSTYINLATVLLAQEKLLEAKDYLDKAQDILNRVMNHTSSQMSFVLDNLGKYHYLIEHYAAAQLCFEKALEIKEKTLGKTHVYYAVNEDQLGTTLLKIATLRGDHTILQKAEGHYIQSIAILQKNYGAAHSSVAIVKNNLGTLKTQQGKYEQALHLFQEAVGILRGKTHPFLEKIEENISNLADLLNNMEAVATVPFHSALHDQYFGFTSDSTFEVKLFKWLII